VADILADPIIGTALKATSSIVTTFFVNPIYFENKCFVGCSEIQIKGSVIFGYR